jgi:hypothetical protein
MSDPVREIELDASSWLTVHDFYDALLAVLEAPEWHGRNLNALIDSMIWGGINTLKPPYRIKIVGSRCLPNDLKHNLTTAIQAIVKGRADYRSSRQADVDVSLEADF